MQNLQHLFFCDVPLEKIPAAVWGPIAESDGFTRAHQIKCLSGLRLSVCNSQIFHQCIDCSLRTSLFVPSVIRLSQSQNLKRKPRERECDPLHSHCLSLLSFSQPAEQYALPRLQKKSQPPTDCLYTSQEEAFTEATPGTVKLSLPLEWGIDLMLTLGKQAQRGQKRCKRKTIKMYSPIWASFEDQMSKQHSTGPVRPWLAANQEGLYSLWSMWHWYHTGTHAGIRADWGQ